MEVQLFLFVFIITSNILTLFGERVNNENNGVVLKKTIWKCCPDNKYVGKRKACQPYQNDSHTQLDFSDIPIYDGNINPTKRFLNEVFDLKPGFFYNDTITSNTVDRTLLQHKYFLTEDGYLLVMVPHEFRRWHKIDPKHFCVDYRLPNPGRKIYTARPTFWCMAEQNQKKHNIPIRFYAYGFLVSSVFLTLVLLVYCLLPELRNLGGLIVMAYVASMLGSFILLAIIQFGRYSKVGCVIMTCLAYFFILATFCWMNIMSCDIWWTFRGYAKARPIHRRGERFKYAMYCVYAWGLPFAMMILLIVLNFVDMKNYPWIVTPRILNRGCFLKGDAQLVYLYVPLLILIAANWIFFLMTVFNIWRLHRSTNMLDSASAGTSAAHRKQKYRLLIYLKLSIIMGVNWILEVVSSFNPELSVWYITDAYNVLIGFFIFLIFVCKKKIFKRVLQELGITKRFQQFQSSKTKFSSTTDLEPSQGTQLTVCANPKPKNGSTPFLQDKL